MKIPFTIEEMRRRAGHLARQLAAWDARSEGAGTSGVPALARTGGAAATLVAAAYIVSSGNAHAAEHGLADGAWVVPLMSALTAMTITLTGIGLAVSGGADLRDAEGAAD